MNVTYEHKPALTFIGYSTQIPPDEGYIQCPAFWQEQYTRKYARLWQTMQPQTPVEQALLDHRIGCFAICNCNGSEFDYWIAGLYRGGDVPEGLKLFSVPEGDWAMFSARGPLPGSLQTLNTQVWQEWYPAEGKRYQGSSSLMLEVYTPGNMQSPDYECGIWIPVHLTAEPAAPAKEADTTAQTVSTMTLTGIL